MLGCLRIEGVDQNVRVDNSGSTGIVVKVAAMQRAYGSEIPGRQFGGGRTNVHFSLDEGQDPMLHQLPGIGTGLDGYLR